MILNNCSDASMYNSAVLQERTKAWTLKYMSGVLKNATHRLFERKDQCLVLKSGRNRYTCIK